MKKASFVRFLEHFKERGFPDLGACDQPPVRAIYLVKTMNVEHGSSKWFIACHSNCPANSPHFSTKFSATSMPCQVPGDGACKFVSDDILSWLCSLAMAKCSKKSEKKKASCGGAAMRKRLLIKNFVAQMLQQERPQVYVDEGLDFTYGKVDEDQESQHYQQEMEPEMKNDIEDEEAEEEEEVSDEEDDLNDDNSTALSMVHRPNEMVHYGDSNIFYISEDPSRIAPTPLPAASTLCSNSNSSLEPMWEDSSDSYSLLSLTTSGQTRTFNDPMMNGQDENLFYPSNYQGSYLISTSEGHQSTTSVALGGYMTVEHPNGLIEDVTFCDKLEKLQDDYSDDSLSNGSCFTSLVNVNSPVKGNNEDTSLLLAYRRSITDLDTNTVVEEDFDAGVPPTSHEGSCNGVTARSPKKRPLPFAQDDFYNLTLSNSPKRLKL
uniref:Uncharacterized protein n=1 Tax=Panagrolaimus sp. JU765 TaxID=591449 RepID=A0AC34QYG9_9BILA